MSRYRVTALLILLAWVLLGPVGMAFDACAVTIALCEASCGPTACIMEQPTLSAASIAVSPFAFPAGPHLPLATVAGPEHPPRSLPSA
ncbi:MAG TPA: hypothetical protein VJU81_22640 [Methylomirabilota bacterium]|nr:hypothetical protein [Methylomirabilota bacterium]